MSIAKIAFSPLEDALLKKLGEGTGLIGLSIGETETGNLRIDLYFERGKSTTLFDIPIALEVHNHEINPFYHPLGGPTKGLHSGLQPGSSVRAVAVYLGLEIESEQGSIGAFVVTDRGNWLITANHVISENGHYDLLTADDDDGILVTGIETPVSRKVEYVKIKATHNRADVAAALLTQFHPLPGRLYDPPLGTGEPWINPPKGTPIKLYGRSKTKEGTVENPCFSGSVSEPFAPNNPNYVNQILLTSQQPDFVEDGDSGSLVAAFDAGSNQWRPIGLVCATISDPDLTLAMVNPLSDVLAALSNQIGQVSSIMTDWPSINPAPPEQIKQ